MKIFRCFSKCVRLYSSMTPLRINAPLQITRNQSNLSRSNSHLFVSKSKFTSSQEHIETDDELEDFNNINEHLSDIIQGQYVSVKHQLYPNANNDELIKQLNNCASVSEVFDIFNQNIDEFNQQQLAQTVLVLWDLHKMFFYFNVSNNASNLDLEKLEKLNEEFVQHLEENETFTVFLNKISSKITEFDVESLSYMLFYLSKMNLRQNNHIIQNISEELYKKLDVNFSLAALSKYISVAFLDSNKGAFLSIAKYIPKIYEKIDEISTTTELKHLTTCLQCISDILPEDVITRYKNKLISLLGGEENEQNVLNFEDHHIIVKIITFLSYSGWQETNVELINKCLKILVNNLHLLNLNDLLIFYEVFQKNQEPAFILTELYRYMSKFFIQLEENSSPLIDVRLKLLKALVSHCSPQHRPSYAKLVDSYLTMKLTGNALIDMCNVLIILKNSNNKLNKKFWDLMLTVMIKDENFRKTNLFKMCTQYIHFHQEVNYFRHYYFEKKMLDWIQVELQNGSLHYIPMYFTPMASFIILFENDKKHTKSTYKRLLENYNQLGDMENFALAKCYSIKKESQQKPIPNEIKERIKSYLVKPIDLYKSLNLHIKASIMIDDLETATELCKNYSKYEEMSSKILKNVIFCLYATDVFIPEIIDKIADYIVKNKDNILGYNAEKAIYLCYYFGYMPKNDQFFNTIVDIILRDQERMTGLAYIQICLSLCYFHQFPMSLIKHVFNESFLEKLDVELANCYYRDKYPVRVRHRMMQLNRAVCLDYPESNVPWFHQKYIEETKVRYQKVPDTYNFTNNVKIYLDKLFEEKLISKTVITPYGYLIDFVLDIPLSSDKSQQQQQTKIALLLMRPGSYTNVNEQMKGQYQLKIRHLEILGYKVIPINYTIWKNLATGEEKVEYLKNIIYENPKISLSSNSFKSYS